MIPISLTLTGFKGIRDGLGRESITLNFAELTRGAELVALTGRNGRGKSTILDNMTPYPVMPSKAGADGLGAFSYYDEVYLPENHKVFTWDMAGMHYRSHLVIRNQGKRRTEAYLHALHEGAWVPVRLDDGTLCDGRMESYVHCVEGITGSTATFVTTAFSAQNRRQLASYRNGEIKYLLTDLLGLEQIRAYGDQAGELLRLLRTGLLTLRQTRSSAQVEHDKLTDMSTCLGDVPSRAALARGNKQRAAERREACRADLAALQAQRELNLCHEGHRQQLQDERERATDDTRSALEHLDSLARDTQGALRRQQERSAQRLARHETNLASLRAQRSSLQRTIHSGRHVERAARRHILLQKVLELRDHRLEHWQHAAVACAALNADLALKEIRCQALEREAGQAAFAAQELRRRFGLTSEVPCAGTVLQQGCKLLVDARAAQPLLPDASSQLARLHDSHQALQCEVRSLKEEARKAEGAERALQAARSKRCRTEARLSWELQLAARQSDIAQAKILLAETDTRLANVLSESPDAVPSEVGEQAALQSKLEEIASRKITVQASQRAAHARIEQMLCSLPPAFDDAALARAVTAAAQADACLSSAEQTLQTALTDVQRLEDLAHRIAAYARQCEEMDRRILQVEGEVERWSLFAKCMGNDGIVALAIDDAGPELSSRANQLLLACYGARFTVSIQTQLANNSGELREGFEITVHDALRDTSKNLAKMSGGERIWINECLTRAMALYLAESAGRRSSTLFSDEADGAFDAQHKRQFMAMKREVLRIGGYAQEYFISHTPELSAMADAVINLDQYVMHDAGCLPPGNRSLLNLRVESG